MGVTNLGIDHLLNTAFHGGTQAPYWYLGLIYGQGSPGLAAADTSALHAGWVETNIEEESLAPGDVGPGGAVRTRSVPPPRKRWQVVASTARAIGNTAAAAWTNQLSSSWPIYGFLLASGPTQRDATDLLFATLALAGGVKSVAYRETLELHLTLEA